MKRKKIKRSVGKISFFLFPLLIFLFTILVSSFNPNSSQMNKTTLIDTSKIENYSETVKGEIKKILVNEVETYIQKNHKNSKISADILVERCLYYDIDIVFALAQGKIESGMGTAGKAVSTNSVWNVGTFDDGRVLYRYSDQNKSIDPYLKLLHSKYLIRISKSGDTTRIETWDLIKSKSFTDHAGYRYATAQNYETHLRRIVQNINMTTEISFYQDLIRMSSDKMTSIFIRKGLDI